MAAERDRSARRRLTSLSLAGREGLEYLFGFAGISPRIHTLVAQETKMQPCAQTATLGSGFAAFGCRQWAIQIDRSQAGEKQPQTSHPRSSKVVRPASCRPTNARSSHRLLKPIDGSAQTTGRSRSSPGDSRRGPLLPVSARQHETLFHCVSRLIFQGTHS